MAHAALGISGASGFPLECGPMQNPPSLSLSRPRRVAVLGAGIVGLTTAWQLQRDGFDVTVIDQGRPGEGASAANGAQLSYAYVQPLADPALWRQLPKLLLSRRSPFSLRLRADPAQWAWGLRFLAACNAEVSARSTARLLALAEESRDVLQRLLADTRADCDFLASGKLVMYGDEAAFAAARRQMELQRLLGGAEQRALSLDECLRVEPALAGSKASWVGGIHTPGECAADCARLCAALHAVLETRGVRFVLGSPIGEWRREHERLVAVRAGDSWIEADAFIVALGTGAAALGRRLGARVPVYPLKGYSLTLGLPAEGTTLPTVSVTDASRKLVFARLGQRLRVAGLAELAGHDTRLDPNRVAQLRQAATEVFPMVGASDDLRAWAGLRPATPTGVPILGTVPGAPENVLFNAGHGALGFTLAAGSAQRVSHLLQGAVGGPRGLSAFRRSAAKPAAGSA